MKNQRTLVSVAVFTIALSLYNSPLRILLTF